MSLNSLIDRTISVLEGSTWVPRIPNQKVGEQCLLTAIWRAADDLYGPRFIYHYGFHEGHARSQEEELLTKFYKNEAFRDGIVSWNDSQTNKSAIIAKLNEMRDVE